MKKNQFLVKFSVAAMVLGFFSPSFHVVKKDHMTTVEVTLLQKAEARRGGGARKGGARARPSGNRNKKVNRNKNINRNVNRNVNVNKNVNVNHYYGGGRHGGHHHHHHGHFHGRPILAFGAAVAVGSIIAAATMPPSCVTVVHRGVSYRRCDNRYYKPVYQGDTLVYEVVSAPL